MSLFKSLKSGRTLACLVAFLTIVAAFLFMLPFIRQEYRFAQSEYYLYQSYLRLFIETLKRGELPLWNEYVGGGNPATYFGHYPINYTTLFYSLVGYSDAANGWMRFANLAILLLTYIFAARMWKYSYWQCFIGAWIYFGINFCIRILVPDTVANVTTLFPALCFLLHLNIRDHFRERNVLILYFLYFCLWVSGSPITYLFMPYAMICVMFFMAAWMYRLTFKKTALFFVLTLLLPWVVIAYQLYFVIDVISSSSRIRTGLVVSIFSGAPWLAFLRSFFYSSYFWAATLLAYFKWAPRKRFSKFSWYALPVLFIVILKYFSADWISDFYSLFSAPSWWASIVIFGAWAWFLSDRNGLDGLLLPFLLLTALLSNFFYLPENTPGFHEAGYDFQLYAELGLVTQIVLNTLFYFSLFQFKKDRWTQLAVGCLVALYFIRSHLAILLLRWTGIVWYATRDGTIFSFFFSILAIQGLQIFLLGISPQARRLSHYICAAIAFLLCMSMYQKMYQGLSHRYAYPVNEFKQEGPDKIAYLGIREMHRLRETMAQIDKGEKGFYRIFSPENSFFYIAGALQDLHIHEAALYDSCIASTMDYFYQKVILHAPEKKTTDLRFLLPYSQFPKHIHNAFGLNPEDIPYNGFYVFEPKQGRLNQDIEFWWDIAQVKYLIVSLQFMPNLKKFSDFSNYEVVESFPPLNMSVVRIKKEKPYAEFAFLPLENIEKIEDLLMKLNSDDISTLRELYHRVELIDHPKLFGLEWLRQRDDRLRLHIIVPKDGLLIHFESWNKHWLVNAKSGERSVRRVFHLFQGIEVQKGENDFSMEFRPRYFWPLFWLSIIFPFIYLMFAFFHFRNSSKRITS